MAAAGTASSLPLAAQTGVQFSPNGGTLENGGQSISISLCASPELYLVSHTVTFNGSDVTNDFNITGGSQQGCTLYLTATGTVTIVTGTNTLSASFLVNDGADIQNTYPGTQYFTGKPAAAAPLISLEPHNGHNLTLGVPFHVVTGYTTPAYWSLDQPRAVTLTYNSGTVGNRHIVLVRGINTAFYTPQRMSLRLRRADNSYVKFSNVPGSSDSTEIHFTGQPDSQPLAAQFVEALATGAHSFTIVARSYFAGIPNETSAPLRLLVINQESSPHGSGWGIAGVPRLRFGPGDSLAYWNGSGTIQFWRRTSCTVNGANTYCTFTPPNGEFDSLLYHNLGSPGPYRRRLLDGSSVYFDATGRAIQAHDPFTSVTTFAWLDSARIDSIIDPAGKAIDFSYSSGALSTITDRPGSRTTTVTINGSNDVTQIQDPAGGKPLQNASYNTHRLQRRDDRRGSDWWYNYDAAGMIAADSSPSVTLLNASGSPVAQRLVSAYVSQEYSGLYAPGSGTSGTPRTLPNDSLRASITPPNGARRVMRHDAYGGLLDILAPAHEFARYTRNVHGQPITALDSTGEWTYTWDGPRMTYEQRRIGNTYLSVARTWNTTYNRPTFISGTGVSQWTYNYLGTGGRLDSTRVFGEPVTKFYYDSRGRDTLTVDPWGHSSRRHIAGSGLLNTDSLTAGVRRSRFARDGAGRVIATTAPHGQRDSTFYDVLNRVWKSKGALGDTIRFTFGDSLNLTQLVDPRGNVHLWRKNGVGWDTVVVDPRGRADTLSYNLMGLVRRAINRRSQVNEFSYDTLGRLLGRGLSGGSITSFTHSPSRLVAANSQGSDTVRMAGDTAFAISIRGGSVFTVRTRYNPTNRETKVAVWRSGGTVYETAYRSDSLGRLRVIIPPSASGDSLFYATEGHQVRVNLHGRVNMTQARRPRHDLARHSYSVAALESAFGSEFIHDSLGRVVERWRLNRSHVFHNTYDAGGRLTQQESWAVTPACSATDTTSELGNVCGGTPQLPTAIESWAYDLAGNRNGAGDTVETGNRQRAHNGFHFDYDSTGNLVRKVKSGVIDLRLYWNSFNELDSTETWTPSPGWQTTRFGYDAWGRRVRKATASGTTWYVWNDDQVVAEYDSASGSLLRHYTHYAGSDRPHSVSNGTVRRYFASDGMANVTGLFDSLATAIVAFHTYTAFGEGSDTGSVANRMKFGGRELDTETWLYYNRARYYDAQVGRFISEDPAGLAAGVNPYAFAVNDPVNRRDPSGNRCEWRIEDAEERADVSAVSSDRMSRLQLVCEYVIHWASLGNADWGPYNAGWAILWGAPSASNGGWGPGASPDSPRVIHIPGGPDSPFLGCELAQGSLTVFPSALPEAGRPAPHWNQQAFLYALLDVRRGAFFYDRRLVATYHGGALVYTMTAPFVHSGKIAGRALCDTGEATFNWDVQP